MRKPIYKRWWFWTLAVILIIIIAVASSGNKTDTSPGDNQTPKTAEKNQQDNAVTPGDDARNEDASPKIEFRNVVAKTSYGITTVIGEAVNNDDKAHSFTIKVSFYGKDKKLLGTAAGAVNDLNGGEMKIFTAVGSEDYSKADSYRVQVDTIVASRKNVEIPIEFTNITVKSEFGTTTVEGEAKNNDDKGHSFTLVIGFYDKDKKLLGIAVGAVNDIAEGETKTFTAMSPEDYSKVDSYIVQVDTLVE
ncbi:MAG TPA: hypothetical protein GXX46_13290 [Peptococcaceae bacterium]|nr:hypothetical protein [Peptococcaceae bacterium]